MLLLGMPVFQRVCGKNRHYFARPMGSCMLLLTCTWSSYEVAEFEVLSTRNQCNHPSSIASVLSTIIEPFTRGFCYTTCRELAIGWIECDISKMLDEASLFVCSKWQHRICEYEIQPARSTISAESANLESCKCKKRPRDYAASRKH